jgi:two-component system NtrC family sensor kinase
MYGAADKFYYTLGRIRMLSKYFFSFLFLLFCFSAIDSNAIPDEKISQVIGKIDAIISANNITRDKIDKLNDLVDTIWASTSGTDSLSLHLNKIILLAERIGYEKGYAKAQLNYGKSLIIKYDNIRALNYLYRAERIFEKSGDQVNNAYTLLQIGLAYYNQKIYSTAENYFFRSAELFQKINDQNKLSTSLYLTGLCNSELKNFFLAKNNFLNARKIKSILNDKRGVAECNTGLGQLFLNMNLPDSALMSINAALEYVMNNNEAGFGLAKLYLMKATAFIQKENYNEAFVFSKKGLAIAENLSFRNLCVDAYKLFSTIEDKRNNFLSAYDYQKKYLALHDSLYNEEDTKTIAQMESSFLMEQQQKEIDQLEKESKLRKSLSIAFLIITSLAVLLAIILFRLYRFKQKANKKLSEAFDVLRDTQQQLIRHEKLVALGKLASNLAHEIQNPLNFVNNFSELSKELTVEFSNAKSEEEKKEILVALNESLSKINDHGKRADAIIKKIQKQLLEGTGHQLFED